MRTCTSTPINTRTIRIRLSNSPCIQNIIGIDIPYLLVKFIDGQFYIRFEYLYFIACTNKCRILYANQNGKSDKNVPLFYALRALYYVLCTYCIRKTYRYFIFLHHIFAHQPSSITVIIIIAPTCSIMYNFTAIQRES